MTGNLTNTVLSLLDTIWRSEPLMKGATERLKKTLAVLIGFFGGCVAGAAAVSWFGDFCFGPDGLLRRHDYTVDVLGGAPGFNYASDYRDVDGIIFPTKRRVYADEGDYEFVKEPLLVKIDMAEITLAYSS